jgi:hypothetical protein
MLVGLGVEVEVGLQLEGGMLVGAEMVAVYVASVILVRALWRVK